MSDRPTPETAPLMHAAANNSIEAMFRMGCDIERQLAEARQQRDKLAALVGTIRHYISIPTRNVLDITPEEHSHEICASIDAVNSQRDQLARALSSIIRFAELYESRHKCVRDDLSLTIATAKNALKLAKGGGK